MRFPAAWLAVALGLSGCANVQPESGLAGSARIGTQCATATVSIAFDFEGASRSRCVIVGEREFAVVISPEHAPPINPSPWYAFRYEASGGAPVTVHLDYLEARHRYTPKLTIDGATTILPVAVNETGSRASLSLPAGSGTVSGQELYGHEDYERLLGQLVRNRGFERFEIGRSLAGKPIEAVRIGDQTAPHLIILLSRQHPPEVTGAWAFDAFIIALQSAIESDPALSSRFQIFAVPLLNPDGVEIGHWRANLGGVDLNRDWGVFSQPETRAVHDWLSRLDEGVEPVFLLDFHSTNRNLVYVQGEAETSPAHAAFRDAWLGSQTEAIAGFAFTIEPRGANPGQGTTKNWFHARYQIPAYTYEVGDNSQREPTERAARVLAESLPAALEALLRAND